MTIADLRGQIGAAQRDVLGMQQEIVTAAPRQANKLRRRIIKARKWISATRNEIRRLDGILWPGN